MAEVQKQELAKRIRLAFKNVKYPGRKIGDKEELRDLLGKKREELTPQDINRNRAYIFFTYEGLKYYLPSFLLGLLENPEQVYRDVGIDFVEYVLYVSRVEKPSCALCDTFTDEQKQVILEFLVYFVGVHYPGFNRQKSTFDRIEKARRKEADKAIEYWRGCMK